MKMRIRDVLAPVSTGLVLASGAALLSGCEPPTTKSFQAGYRGTGMMQVTNTHRAEESKPNNEVPAPLPKAPVTEAAATAGATFKNVKVLKDVPIPEFTRLMLAVTSWVAPQQGCPYCHNPADMASDSLYTKRVARRMFEMTRHINTDWHQHVADTGVTCFTCHRGHNVPAATWYSNAGPKPDAVYAGWKDGQNAPSELVRLAALPNDPFTQFLEAPHEVKVIGSTALRQDGLGASIKTTEQTYGLMMHFTQSLSVNCTYCHNSRSFFDWDQSTPQRVTAWYGIRLVRDLNTHYLDPLGSVFPPVRHGPNGDGPKLNCATCHQGAFKPLNGVSMVPAYPELKGPELKGAVGDHASSSSTAQ